MTPASHHPISTDASAAARLPSPPRSAPCGPTEAGLSGAERLIEQRPTERRLTRAERLALVKRTSTGLGLAALYGLAIGARSGGAELVRHAVGVPLGLSVVVLLGAPSVFVFLSICRAELSGLELAELVSRAIASAGLSLAGLAPAALLFVLTSETLDAAASAAGAGLLLASSVALVRLVGGLVRRAYRGSAGSIVGALAVSVGFSVFACLLAVRTWSAVLPIFGGAS